MDEFYKCDEVCKIFCISKHAVSNLISQKILSVKESYITPVVKENLFYKDEIDSLLMGYDLKTLLTRKEICEKASISNKRFEYLIKENLIKPIKFKFNKRDTFFTNEDLDKILSLKSTFNLKQKWSYNKDYFKEIDCKEKAYWIGFITGDGYISDNRLKNNKSTAVSLRIRLHPRDTDILQKLNESLEFNKPLKIVKNYGVYEGCNDLVEFDLSSRELIDDLENLGFTSGNKSCKEKVPDIILGNDVFIKNFILGLFDADGYILVDKNNKAEFGICSGIEMCTFVKTYLESNLPDVHFLNIRSSHDKNPNNELYNFRAMGYKNLSKLFEYFYLTDCSNYFLDRKYNIFKSIYETYKMKL